MKGALEVEVRQGDQQQRRLPLLVTKGNGPSLLGRDWLTELRLDWKNTYYVRESPALAAVLNDHRAIFKNGLGLCESRNSCQSASTTIFPQTSTRTICTEAEGGNRARAAATRGHHMPSPVLAMGSANRGSTQKRWVRSTLRRLQSVGEQSDDLRHPSYPS